MTAEPPHRILWDVSAPFVARCPRDALHHAVVYIHNNMDGTYTTVARCDEWRNNTTLCYTACPIEPVPVAPTCLVCAGRPPKAA